jgi:hypothetical protein
MVLALLLACVPVHVHGEEHTSESEEVYFEDRQDAIDYIEKAISQRVSELHLKLPMEVYSSNILTSLYENAVTEETRWTVVPVDWDVKIEAGFVYLHYAFEYLTTAQQEEELNAAVAELLEQLDFNRFNSFACVFLIVTLSPGETRFSLSCLLKPISIASFFISTPAFLSSDVSRWGGVEQITPKRSSLP